VQDSCQTRLVFFCPILELKLIGLQVDSVHVVLVHVRTEQVKLKTASNLVAIFWFTVVQKPS
jgi:hypothetical protein